MPKQIVVLNQFHGGLSSSSDPRDIAPNSLSEAVDIMVDNVGKIRTMGGTAAQGAGSPEDDNSAGWNQGSPFVPGYGLFQFSHDRTGAENKSHFTALHDGGDVAALTDSGESWVTDAFIGGTVYNITQASTGLITDSNGTTVTAAVAAGNWANNDLYVISMPETGDDYIAIYDDNDGQVWIYSRTRDAWDDRYSTANTGAIDLGATTDAKLAFYFVDGALRVSDGNFGATNETKWYGYIHRWVLGDGTAGYDGGRYNNGFLVSRWHTDEVAPKALAVKSFFGNHDAGATPDASSPIAVELDSSGVSDTTTAWFPESDTQWECAVSTLYDDSKQESPLYVVGGEASPTTVDHDNIVDGDANFDKRELTIVLHVFADTNPGETSLDVNHPRVSGFKIYMRIEGETTWYLQAEVDVTEGMKRMDRGGYKAWATSADLTECAYCQLPKVNNPRIIETYEHETGFDANIQSVGFEGTGTGFKTAVVTNRIAYVGNAKIKDWHGNIQHYGDAVFKSIPGKFDSFTPDNRLEASIRDGDEIVKLEEFADRLLVFKKNKMELLNISQEVEFLEDTFVHKGVSHPAATCKTDFGIAWVNNHGCFLYDGQNVNNLFEKQGIKVITDSDWTNFLTVDKDGASAVLTPMIGYVPNKRQLIIFDDITAGSDADPRMFLYDIVTQSWVKGAKDASNRITDMAKTNFINDWNGDLVYSYSTGSADALLKWSDASVITDTISFKTKDIDFGQPAQRKKIYKVYVSYKGDGSAVTVKYQTNGNTDAGSNFLKINADGSSSGATDSATPLHSSTVGTNDWVSAELKPVASINNVKSFQLLFDGTAASNFEINDISIVYRMKGIK